MKSVANTSSMPKLSCVEKRLIYEQQKKEESRVMVTKDQGMIRYNNSYITRKNMNVTHFYDQYPDCKPNNFVDLGLIQSSSNEVVKRRRLVIRYSLCDLGTPTDANGNTWSNGNKYYSGEHTISANYSILSTIYIRGTLKITGVADSNGAKPSIDGGWDGAERSDTGVTLFRVENGDELTIENMILTNGQVSIFRPFLILLITFVIFT